MYTNILVCFDDSEGSKKALDKASNIYFSMNNCKITVLQVNSESIIESPTAERAAFSAVPRVDGGIFATDLSHLPIEDTLERNRHNQMEESMHYAKEIFSSKGINAEFEYLDGYAAPRICEYAESHPVDLIIVGNSGKSGLKKFFIGSVSEYIVKNSERDVLVVK